MNLAKSFLTGPFRGASALILLTVAGCSAVPDSLNPVEWVKDVRDLFEDDEPTARTATASRPDSPALRDPGAGKPYPNLASVPEKPKFSTADERRTVAQALIADRDNARYSDEVIRRQTDDETAPPARAPERVVASAGTPRAAEPAQPAPRSTQAAAAVAPSPREALPPVPPSALAAIVPSAGGSPARTVPSAQPPAPPVVAAPASIPAAPPAPPVIAPPPARIAALSPPPPAPAVMPRPPVAASIPALAAAPPPPAVIAPAPALQSSPDDTRAGRAAAETADNGSTPYLPQTRARPNAQPPLGRAARGPANFGAPPSDIAIVQDELRRGRSPESIADSSLALRPAAADLAALAPSAGPALLSIAGRKLATINFARGGSGISSEARALLREIAAMQRIEGRTIRIVGHASAAPGGDSVARRISNFNVSQDRATAIAAALIELGARPEVIEIAAMADAEPLERGVAATHPANQRAEIFMRN